MKRTAAIIFLILANFIILVHAVVPHHHHYHDDIYYIHNHADDCCNSSIFFSLTHDSDDCSHDDSEKDFCKLQDLLSKLVLNTKEREAFITALEADFQDYYIAQLLMSDMEQEVEQHTYKPYIFYLPHSEVVALPLLRAPPYC